jgi:hypothetical protein
MLGAVVSIVTLDALEFEALLEFVLELEDVLAGLDDIWLVVLELICDVTEPITELALLSVLLVATFASEEV